MGDSVRDVIRSLLDEKPALRDDIETLLARDSDGPWTFQDVPVDSGAFGELVDSGLVEDVGDGYRLTDPDAIRSSLHGDETETPSNATAGRQRLGALFEGVELPNRRRAAAVVGALILLALVRVLLMVPSVFRPTGIVLAGNDPYMYHHILEQLAAGNLSAFNPGDITQLSIEFLQFEVRTHDTFFIVVLWWVSSALGGTSAVGPVLAWYPVVAALITGFVVYLVTVQLTDDVRCGLASILLLAITPAHAFRTALGFGDHHAFDYIWLVFTAAAVLVVATERFQHKPAAFGISRRGWIAIGGGGFSIAAQSAAWRGGPLLIIPIAVYTIAQTYIDVRDGESPLLHNAPLLMLVAIGAAVTLGFHYGFNWLEPARAFAPLLLFIGVTAVVGFASLIQRIGLPAWTTVAGEAGGAVFALLVLPRIFPPIAGAATALVAYFQTYSGSGIAETQSLFSGELGAIVAPIFLFGFVLFLAVPYMVWTTWQKASVESHPGWLAVATYGWWFFALAIIQNRFSGELSLFTAIFAGIGFVHLAAWVDLAEPVSLFTDNTVPSREGVASGRLPSITEIDRQTLLQLGVLFLLVGSLGGIQTVVKTNQIAVSETDYQTGIWLEEYADERGLSYPENYVLSEWGYNRADNYLVNGETESYEYAQTTYGTFLGGNTTEGWYQRLEENHVGFILVREVSGSENGTVYNQLYGAYGSQTDTAPALEHYRAIYATAENERIVFAVVDGATVVGTAEPGTTFTAETTTTLPPTGKTITYSQQVQVGDDGRYQFTTPYPGNYSLANGEVMVPESAVVDGRNVSAAD